MPPFDFGMDAQPAKSQALATMPRQMMPLTGIRFFMVDGGDGISFTQFVQERFANQEFQRSPQKRLVQPAIDRDDLAGGLAQPAGEEEEKCLGLVAGSDGYLGQRAVGV